MRMMRSPIRRRSVSICVSPGPPRKPKPPRCRSRWVHERTRRERWYLRCASSTCSAPSAVRARWPKISRMSPVRSMTFAAEGFLEVALLGGRERAVHHDEVDRLVLHPSRDRLDLALADKGRRADFVQRNGFRAHDLEIDGARQSDRLFAAGLGAAHRVIRVSGKIGADDERARGRAPLRSRPAARGGVLVKDQRGSSSTASNMVIGLAGMIVEIACL